MTWKRSIIPVGASAEGRRGRYRIRCRRGALLSGSSIEHTVGIKNLIRYMTQENGKAWLCAEKETEKDNFIRRTILYGPSEIDELSLPKRLVRVLKRAGMDTFEKILGIEDKTAFLRIRNIGEKGYMQVIEALEAKGLDIRHLK